MTSAPEIVSPPTLTDPASPRAADPPYDRATTASTRSTAAMVGLLFLAATAAFIAGVLSRPDFLTGAAADTPALATGALLVFGQFGVVGIAVLLFPLLTIDAATSTSLGALLHAQYSVAILMIYLVTSAGGLCMAVLLYRSRLIPRPIATLGLIGYPALLAGCVLDLFNLVDLTQGIGLVALVPGGVFELVLPIWLLAKGFSYPRNSADTRHHG